MSFAISFVEYIGRLHGRRTRLVKVVKRLKWMEGTDKSNEKKKTVNV